MSNGVKKISTKNKPIFTIVVKYVMNLINT